MLVGLDGRRSIDAFNALGCEEVARYVEEHRTEDLFYRIELGLIDTCEFCEEIRQMTATTASTEEMVGAWNALLTGISNNRRESLYELRRLGYRLFLLSNTNEMHWQHCVRNGFPVDVFEQVFLSYEMHLAKPSREIFSEVLRAGRLKASETLFVDDNPDNVSMAKRLGIQTFLNQEIEDWICFLALQQ